MKSWSLRIIERKRDGLALTREDIACFVAGVTDGAIPDYQISALLMAIFCRGMNLDESTELTREMLNSGATLDWGEGRAMTVDKHSTGGVGDKTSLIIAPLLACAGLRVPMISGRGLGPTGGTLDKLESIPGYRVNLTIDEMTALVNEIGCVIVGANRQIAPADAKLYALRDVTATVPSIPLITASILSKKLAEGIGGLVIDVKFGSGAFMQSYDDALALSRSLVDVGHRLGVDVCAVLTDMNQPLGQQVGNLNEVLESIDVLQGQGPADVRELSLRLCAELLYAMGRTESVDTALESLSRSLDNGDAYGKFAAMVAAQGGDLDALPVLPDPTIVRARQSGCVASIDTGRLGRLVIELGGGRRELGDAILHDVGMRIHKRIGDEVQTDEPLAEVFHRGELDPQWMASIRAAFQVSNEPCQPAQLVRETIVRS